MIPYGRQSICDADIEAVVQVLRSDYLTQGPVVPAFERMVANRVGSAHSIAVNSATSALHIACLALDVGPGDIVWTSPITFVATSNVALYCGATIDFVDIDPLTFNLDPARLADKLEIAMNNDTLPKVVIPVHIAGQSCDMAAIAELARRYGFRVIEDASHAVGANYGGGPVGNCQFSDVTVFSFHPVKIITTGEGGLALTNDAELAQRMGLLRSHGITRDPAQMTKETEGGWYYEQRSLGFNYRMTEMQAALGCSQMERIEEFIARRRELAAGYDRKLAGVGVRLPAQHPDTVSSWHLYIVRFDASRHLAAYEALRTGGIGVNLHYMPVYLQPYYRELGFRPGLCPEAELYYAEAISIPIYAGMSDGDQDTVVEQVARAVSG